MEEKTHRGESSAKVEAETEAMQPQAGEAGNQQKLERAQNRFFPRASRESMALPTL